MYTKLPLALLTPILLWTACGENIAPSNYKLAPENSSWYERHSYAILDADKSKNLYQLKVMPQKHNECTLHQTRNLFFAMAMLERTERDFEKEYKRLVDNDLFEAMMLKTVCDIEIKNNNRNVPAGFRREKPAINETRIRRSPDIKLFLAENADFATYIPAQSDRYVHDVLEFSRYINQERFKTVLALAKDELPVIEKRALPEHLLTDFAALTASGLSWLRANDDIVRLYHSAELLHREKNFLLPIKINLNSVGTILHAVSLLVRKIPDTHALEFVFMDPLNWKVTTTETYRKTIDTVIRLVNNPRHFRDSLIRSGYFTAVNYLKTIGNMERVFFTYPLFAYLEVLENLAALDDDFFLSHYKNPTCEMITRTLEGAPIAVDLHTNNEEIHDLHYPDAKAELLKRFSCH